MLCAKVCNYGVDKNMNLRRMARIGSGNGLVSWIVVWPRRVVVQLRVGTKTGGEEGWIPLGRVFPHHF